MNLRDLVREGIDEALSSNRYTILQQIKCHVRDEYDMLDLLNYSTELVRADPQRAFYSLCALVDVLKNTAHIKKFSIGVKSDINQYMEFLLQLRPAAGQYFVPCMMEISKVVTLIIQKSYSQQDVASFMNNCIQYIKTNPNNMFMLYLSNQLLIIIIKYYPYRCFDDELCQMTEITAQLLFNEENARNLEGAAAEQINKLLIKSIQSYYIAYESNNWHRALPCDQQVAFLMQYFDTSRMRLLFGSYESYQSNYEFLMTVCQVSSLCKNQQAAGGRHFVLCLVQYILYIIIRFEVNDPCRQDASACVLLQTLISTLGGQTFIGTLSTQREHADITFQFVEILHSVVERLLRLEGGAVGKDVVMFTRVVEVVSDLMVSCQLRRAPEADQFTCQLQAQLRELVVGRLSLAAFDGYCNVAFQELFAMVLGMEQDDGIPEMAARLAARYDALGRAEDRVLFLAHFASAGNYCERLVAGFYELVGWITKTQTSVDNVWVQMRSCDFLILSLKQIFPEDDKARLYRLNSDQQWVLLGFLLKLACFAQFHGFRGYQYVNSYISSEAEIDYVDSLADEVRSVVYNVNNMSNMLWLIKLLSNGRIELQADMAHWLLSEVTQLQLDRFAHPRIFILLFKQQCNIDLLTPAQKRLYFLYGASVAQYELYTALHWSDIDQLISELYFVAELGLDNLNAFQKEAVRSGMAAIRDNLSGSIDVTQAGYLVCILDRLVKYVFNEYDICRQDTSRTSIDVEYLGTTMQLLYKLLEFCKYNECMNDNFQDGAVNLVAGLVQQLQDDNESEISIYVLGMQDVLLHDIFIWIIEENLFNGQTYLQNNIVGVIQIIIKLLYSEQYGNKGHSRADQFYKFLVGKLSALYLMFNGRSVQSEWYINNMAHFCSRMYLIQRNNIQYNIIIDGYRLYFEQTFQKQLDSGQLYTFLQNYQQIKLVGTTQDITTVNVGVIDGTYDFEKTYNIIEDVQVILFSLFDYIQV